MDLHSEMDESEALGSVYNGLLQLTLIHHGPGKAMLAASEVMQGIASSLSKSEQVGKYGTTQKQEEAMAESKCRAYQMAKKLWDLIPAKCFEEPVPVPTVPGCVDKMGNDTTMGPCGRGPTGEGDGFLN